MSSEEQEQHSTCRPRPQKAQKGKGNRGSRRSERERASSVSLEVSDMLVVGTIGKIFCVVNVVVKVLIV